MIPAYNVIFKQMIVSILHINAWDKSLVTRNVCLLNLKWTNPFTLFWPSDKKNCKLKMKSFKRKDLNHVIWPRSQKHPHFNPITKKITRRFIFCERAWRSELFWQFNKELKFRAFLKQKVFLYFQVVISVVNLVRCFGEQSPVLPWKSLDS